MPLNLCSQEIDEVVNNSYINFLEGALVILHIGVEHSQCQYARPHPTILIRVCCRLDNGLYTHADINIASMLHDLPYHGAFVLGHIALVHHPSLPLLIHNLCHLIRKTSVDLHSLFTVTVHVFVIVFTVPFCY